MVGKVDADPWSALAEKESTQDRRGWPCFGGIPRPDQLAAGWGKLRTLADAAFASYSSSAGTVTCALRA